MATIDEVTRYRARYVEQMAKRKEWLEEERGNMEVIEDIMREMKQEAAGYIAIGDTQVIGIVEGLEAGLKEVRQDRLKGIPEPDHMTLDLAALEQKCAVLWDEKLAFGVRRPRWTQLRDRAETVLQEVQSLPPPKKKGEQGGGGNSGGIDLDLDF